jgi:hypothetical protein
MGNREWVRKRGEMFLSIEAMLLRERAKSMLKIRSILSAKLFPTFGTMVSRGYSSPGSFPRIEASNPRRYVSARDHTWSGKP